MVCVQKGDPPLAATKGGAGLRPRCVSPTPQLKRRGKMASIDAAGVEPAQLAPE